MEAAESKWAVPECHLLIERLVLFCLKQNMAVDVGMKLKLLLNCSY